MSFSSEKYSLWVSSLVNAFASAQTALDLYKNGREKEAKEFVVAFRTSIFDSKNSYTFEYLPQIIAEGVSKSLSYFDEAVRTREAVSIGKAMMEIENTFDKLRDFKNRIR